MMALAMIVTLSQCKKQNEENEDNTAKVRISCTIPLNNDGKTDFTSDGNVNWSENTEIIYLAIPATQELVELTSTSEEGGATLTFTGSVQSGILENGAEYDVWYLGRGESKLNNDGTLKGSITTQSGNLSDLGNHHIAKTTVTANGNTLTFNGNFKNQIAIVRLGEESASTNILRGNAIIGTEYSLEYDGDKYDIAITGEKSINVTNPTNESYVVLFPNEETNVELISDSGKKVTFLNGINAGSIYTVGWEDYEEGPNANGYEYVDLGLPSGLLWATCNVGANSPEEYGNYYAWGETSTKETYDYDNCATYGLSISELQSQGYIDGAGNLNPQYDAAAANWGGDWRMPTYDELNELRTQCTWTWTTQNGVNGFKVTGPSGASIFLPAAGYRYGSSLNDAGSLGGYWSSTPYENYDSRAYYLIFDNDYHGMSYGNLRINGRSVRPVSGGNNAEPEEPETPEIPDNNGHEYVDLGLPSGLLWATCNVGANSPEEFGDYYAWGMTETKNDYSSSNCPTYGLTISQLKSQGYIDGEGNLTAQYDAAAANWGGDWRMPTKAEQEELFENCTWTWTTQNGVDGYMVFTSKKNGNSILLPAAGLWHGPYFDYAGRYGYYWSSTPHESDKNYYNAYDFYFCSSGPDLSWNYRYAGQSVRPVLK